jgi:chromate transporter
MPHPAAEVFSAFLRLGVTSFGGPIAHLGYFRREFVERRRWLDDAQFAQLLSIAQFLPGPASSQLGFGIGLVRAGWLGGLAAFTAFTLPSAVLLVMLALLGATLGGPWWTAAVHGLKLVAVVVVADGVWRMARHLTPDLSRVAVAAAAAVLVLALPTAAAQLLAIGLGALLGLMLLRDGPAPPRVTMATVVGRRAAFAALAVFAIGLGAALLFAAAPPTTETGAAAPRLVDVAATFWRAGSLVFGGGHVVLPLLAQGTVATGWIGENAFLAGYGAAQAIPGPMFSLAAYLGASVPTAAPPVVGAVVATLAVFAPGFLLLVAVLPVWSRLTVLPAAMRAVAGVNAAVVGLLAAALYDPVIVGAVDAPRDLAILAIAAAIQWKVPRPTLWVVACCVALSLAT